MEIVLVCLNNFQQHILVNIKNLLRFQNNNITVITDTKFFDHFKEFNINLIAVEELQDDYNTYTQKLSNTFRNGFWELTSYRFKVLYSYMKKYNKQDVIHIENDVMIFKNMCTINFHNKDKILLTMDSQNRCIPGIMYIPNYLLLEQCLQNFQKGLNDMQNWANCYHNLTPIIDTLPIFNELTNTPVQYMITKNFKHYNAIFDAAAIGQYLGGIDPRNIPGKNTIGFINETCIIDYSKFNIQWVIDENHLKVPVITINNTTIPIVNLHIHSKNLKHFYEI